MAWRGLIARLIPLNSMAAVKLTAIKPSAKNAKVRRVISAIFSVANLRRIPKLASMATNNKESDFQRIRQELDSGEVQEDLWLRAVASSGGTHSKAVSTYISLRAERLYQENTTAYQRAADTTIQALDPRSRRGQILSCALVIGIALVILFSVQPVLRASAKKNYDRLYEKAKAADVIGKDQRYLFQQLGKPDVSRSSDNSLVYIYNTGSVFCFGRHEYDLKVFMDLQTGHVMGIDTL